MRSRTPDPEIRRERIRLPPLSFTLEAELGEYYQDFSPALGLVESGHHGPLDSRGIPLVHYPGQGDRYNVITIAQYALANLSALARGEQGRHGLARRLCDWLVEAQGRQGPDAGLWRQPFENPKYSWLRAGWASALAQGSGISALLRARERFGEPAYAAAARAAYDALHRADLSPRLCIEEQGTIWYEEYPADPPLHVLNGHVYAMLGIVDMARVTGDPEPEHRWRAAVEAVRSTLDRFDTGYWSVYDLHTRELASDYYHRDIHVPQLHILAALTGDPTFAVAARRWEGYQRDHTARARRWLMSRLKGGARHDGEGEGAES